jgi:hypothetical protein
MKPGNSMVVAHGIGGRQDLPIPLSLLLAGAAIAVVASFVALSMLWRRPRLRGAAAGRPLPIAVQRVADHPATRAALRLSGLALAAFTVIAAALGPNDGSNPAPWLVYVVFWVGLIPASLLFGPVWRLVNPLRTVHRGIAWLVGGRPLLTLPDRVGYWPAAAGLFAFTWLELVSPDPDRPTTVLLFFAVYAIIMIVCSAIYGAVWFDKADPFEAYSTLIGRLAPLGRRDDRRLVLRNPFNGLAGLGAAPGLVAAICVMLGSTGYDGFSRSPFWVNTLQDGPLPSTIAGTLGLAGFVALVAATYWVATRSTGPAALIHSLIPIAVGYLIAHYFSLLLFGGQQAIILASDPLDNGSNLFGTATLTVDSAILGATAIAVIRAAAVVTGHVTGVFAAHDKAVALLPRGRAITGQLPLLIIMVFYTVGGLTLLFAA